MPASAPPPSPAVSRCARDCAALRAREAALRAAAATTIYSARSAVASMSAAACVAALAASSSIAWRACALQGSLLRTASENLAWQASELAQQRL